MATLVFDSSDGVVHAVKQLDSSDSEAFWEAIDWVNLRDSVGLVGRHVLYRPGLAPVYLEGWLEL